MPTKDTADISSMLKYSWFRAGFLAVQSLLGWPMYLLFNASGREYSRFANHFDPLSPIFSRRERPGVRLHLCFGWGDEVAARIATVHSARMCYTDAGSWDAVAYYVCTDQQIQLRAR